MTRVTSTCWPSSKSFAAILTTCVGSLARAENHFGKIFAQRAVRVHLGKAEVGRGRGLKGPEDFFERDFSGAKLFQQFSGLGGCHPGRMPDVSLSVTLEGLAFWPGERTVFLSGKRRHGHSLNKEIIPMNDHHHHAKGLNRRDFLRLGSTGAAGVAITGLGTLAASAQQAAPPAPPAPSKLPTRRYGKTGLQISALVGASDWNADVIPLAVESGVNYWHKAHRWTAQNMPDAIKSQPRESYYLEVVVDRVDGDNAHGRIDEEQHYQFVKSAWRPRASATTT